MTVWRKGGGGTFVLIFTGLVPLLSRAPGRVGGLEASKVEPRFEETWMNNSLVVATIGRTVSLPCTVFMKQSATVSWSVQRKSTMDLLTVGNTTFTGDQRVSVQVGNPRTNWEPNPTQLNPTNWGLRIEKVVPSDAGRYVCTLETFPKKSLFLLLQVNGPEMEIVNSSQGLVYSAGSYLSMKCVYRNSSLAPQPVTTPHPLFPVQNHWHLPSDTLLWRHNNKTFSLRNRKRVRAAWTGSAVVSTLSIKSAIKEDSGNYSCLLPSTSLTVTASLQILKAEHSSELKPETLQTAAGALPLQPSLLLLILLLLLLIS